MVRGFISALAHGKEGEIYNLCSGKETTLHEVLKTFIELAAVPIRIQRAGTLLRPFDPVRIIGDCSRAYQEINWMPTISLKTTLQDTLNYWRTIADREKGESSGN